MDDKLHFEDLVVGEARTFGAYPVTRDEVIDFAGKYDPQPFHLDDEAAQHSIFGRLAASGWQTAAITMRLMVDHFIGQSASLGGAGVDNLRWIKPVYPGDTLSVRSTLLEKRRSRSRPDMGLMRTRQETLNQHGEVVMVYESMGLIGVRDPSAPIED